METIHPDPPYEKPTPHPDNRFMALTSNCTDMPTLLVDTHAPLDILMDAANYRIRTVTQVLENLSMRGSIECESFSSATFHCFAPSRCAMAVMCWMWSDDDYGRADQPCRSEPVESSHRRDGGQR